MVAHCNLKSSWRSKTNSLLCHFKTLAWRDIPFKWLSSPWNFKVFHFAIFTICQLYHLRNLAWTDFPCKCVFDYFISWYSIQMGLIIRTLVTYWDSNSNLGLLGCNVFWKQEENQGRHFPPAVVWDSRHAKKYEIQIQTLVFWIAMSFKNKKRTKGDITPLLLYGTARRLQKNELKPFTEQ